MSSEGRLDTLALLASDVLIILGVIGLVVLVILVVIYDAKVLIAVELEIVVLGLRTVS